jgi:hypothetical protein
MALAVEFAGDLAVDLRDPMALPPDITPCVDTLWITPILSPLHSESLISYRSPEVKLIRSQN